ncbi:MAG: hypothetical protein V4508_12780 [Pseudomonadota bacterium]
MSKNPAFDASIPVLTEVLDEKAAQPLDQVNAELEQRAIDSWSEPEWNLLERRLSERILQQLQGRVDFVLEQRLRDSMEEVLKNALTGLTDEIQHGLARTIEKIVARAVAQEVAHLQTLKK